MHPGGDDESVRPPLSTMEANVSGIAGLSNALRCSNEGVSNLRFEKDRAGSWKPAERRNALSEAHVRELIAALRPAGGQLDMRAVMLCGFYSVLSRLIGRRLDVQMTGFSVLPRASRIY